MSYSNFHNQYSNEGKTNPCPICKEEMNNIGYTDCSHQFCLDCILEWKKISSSCPLCRRELHLETSTEIKELEKQLQKEMETFNSNPLIKTMGFIDRVINSFMNMF